MTKYVLRQWARSPHSIVGSIDAPDLVAAANTGRALYGSFHVTEWAYASLADRTEAELQDRRADQLEQRAMT